MYDLVVGREAHRRLIAAGEATALPPGPVKALMQLDPDKPQAMKELAEVFRCDASYVTSLVDDLEQAGYAERQPHPSDRRVKVVALTEPGGKALARVREIIGEPPEWFSVLTPNEQAQLARLLGKLQAAKPEAA